MLILGLTLLALLTGMLHIGAAYRGLRHAVYVLKPLTTTLILLIALLASSPVSSFYKTAIVIGLLFSLVGDILLMLPADRFVAGLVSFLLTHLCYIAAFTSRSGFHLSIGLLTPFIAYGVILLRLLWSYVGKLKAPVLMYMVVILVMSWQAAEQGRQVEQIGARLALLGAVLFLLSDSALALNRFRKPFKSASVIVLSTYYVAQLLIAGSVQ
jgi:uncharacterized membrane protein YhhN